MPTIDKAIVKALKEKRELERRLAEIEQFIRLYREFSEGTAEGAATADKPDESVQTPGKEPIHPSLLLRGPDAVVKVSSTALREAGEPLTRGQLAAELEARKVRLPGKDKESRARYVGTIMWRNRDRFEHVQGRGYWFKDIPIPETERERRQLQDPALVI